MAEEGVRLDQTLITTMQHNTFNKNHLKKRRRKEKETKTIQQQTKKQTLSKRCEIRGMQQKCAVKKEKWRWMEGGKEEERESK